MADKRIAELNALTITASTDEALISDTSASETKKITLANVFNKVPTWLGFADTVTTMAADVLPVPVTASICHKTSGADAEALTIVAGTSGQVLIVIMIVDGGGTEPLVVLKLMVRLLFLKLDILLHYFIQIVNGI